MKAEIYIFGNFADGYSQHPDDSNRELFATVSNNRKGSSEIVYHRENSLSYYIYLREISHSSGAFIGLCYVFNDVFINDFSNLFDVFEDAITNLVVTGELVEFTNDGQLTSKVDQLYAHQEELQRIADHLNNRLPSLERHMEKLPLVNYSISNAEWKTVSFDDISEIQPLIRNYDNVRVIKGENYDAEALKGYAAKLKSQNARIKDLEKENTKLQRQKKQFTVVVILMSLIAIGVLIFAYVINNKNEHIRRKNDLIDNLQLHRDRLQSDSARLTSVLNQTTEMLEITEEKMEKLQDDYVNLQIERDTLFAMNAAYDTANNELTSQVSMLEASNANLEQTNYQLRNRNAELERMVADLRGKNSSNSSYTVGASTSHSVKGHDNSFAQWLYAAKTLKINSFYVHSDQSGYVTIGLYKSNGSLASSCQVYVYANQWNKVIPNNFVLYESSKYYLAIKNAEGISLGYHSSNSSEYNGYKNGSLRILGVCHKGNSDYGTNYYQYFYNINYSILN